MYNPLFELTPQALIGLISLRHLYWVQQSYSRGLQLGVEASFLLTPYKDKGNAQDHFDHIAGDSHGRLYRLELKPGDPINKITDGQDLIAASKHPTGKRFYIAFTDGKSLPGWLQKQVHEGAKRIGWAGRNMGTEARLGFDYGKLVVRYYCKNEVKKIPLEEIESY